MTKLERRHLRKFQRVCAAAGLPKPTARNLCESAILKPSRNLQLGNFFGENACALGEVVSVVLDAQFVKRAEGNDFWAIEILADEEKRYSTYTCFWYISFITDADGTESVARFALDEGGRTNELLRKDWEYVQRF